MITIDFGRRESYKLSPSSIFFFSIPNRFDNVLALSSLFVFTLISGCIQPNSKSCLPLSTQLAGCIQPLKARHFDSSWNWVRQDALMMYYDIIFGRLTTVDREITARCIHLLNRADPEMLAYMQYNIDHCDPSKGETYKLAKEFGQQLIDNTRQVLGQPPVYKDGMFCYFSYPYYAYTCYFSHFPNCSAYRGHQQG